MANQGYFSGQACSILVTSSVKPAYKTGICGSSDKEQNVEKEIKINMGKETKKKYIEKGNKNNVDMSGIAEVYDMDSDVETVCSVFSASSESVIVIETVEIVKDIDKKGKEKIYIEKRKQKSSVVVTYNSEFFSVNRTVRKRTSESTMWYESWDPCEVTRNTETDTLSGFSVLDSDEEYEECELERLESNEREYAGVYWCDLRGHSIPIFRRATPAVDMDCELLESVRDCASVCPSRASTRLTFCEQSIMELGGHHGLVAIICTYDQIHGVFDGMFEIYWNMWSQVVVSIQGG